MPGPTTQRTGFFPAENVVVAHTNLPKAVIERAARNREAFFSRCHLLHMLAIAYYSYLAFVSGQLHTRPGPGDALFRVGDDTWMIRREGDTRTATTYWVVSRYRDALISATLTYMLCKKCGWLVMVWHR